MKACFQVSTDPSNSMKNPAQDTSGRNATRTTLKDVVNEIKRRGNAEAVVGMARFGIRTSAAFGVSVPRLREMSRKIGKDHEWSTRREEYVKRAGFVLMAELAVHDKNAPDRTFLEFLPLIIKESSDDRNFVKKAVNWALRQIGKRNMTLNKAAIQAAKTIQTQDSACAKWIAADALRELTSPQVQKRLIATKAFGK